VLVVNDSGEEIPWVHPFVRMLDTGGNFGPAKARNMGIAAARGKQILLLDADDYLQPEAIAYMYAMRQDSAYVYCDWIKQETKEVYKTDDYDCNAVLQRLPHAITGLYPIEAWKAVGGFDENLDAWEDWDFAIALAVAGYFGIRAPRPLFQYRMKGGFRREEQYKNREILKQNIYAKWAKYIDRKEELMACRTCGGRRITPVPAPIARVAGVLQPVGGMVMIEYLPTDGSTKTYRGQSTGTLYRFGSDPGHKIRNVFQRDAAQLLAREEFRAVAVGKAVEAPVAALEALGPPKR